jgi:hypothetical protein
MADIQHMAGQDNVAADALSWDPASSATVAHVLPGMIKVLHGIAERQSSCSSMLQACKFPSLQVKACEVEGVSMLCDVSTGCLRAPIPEAGRLLMFRAIHGVAHPGIWTTRKMISARLVWPGMWADVASWCRDCMVCQRAKVTKQTLSPVQAILIPSRRFSHVHVDLVGPVDGFIYLMTMVDQATRWLEAVPLKGIVASSCIEVFLSTWIANFGVLEMVTSDRGTQFFFR